MALWHTLVRNVRGLWVPDGDAWDDGATCQPGDADFTTEHIISQAAGRMFNYVCTNNWEESAV